MDRREVLKLILAGLVAPRLLTPEESVALDVPVTTSKTVDDATTWTTWAVPADTPVECPDGITFFKIVSQESETEQTLEQVTVETQEGLTYMQFAFNSMSPVTWDATLENRIFAPVTIKVSCPAVITVRSAGRLV